MSTSKRYEMDGRERAGSVLLPVPFQPRSNRYERSPFPSRKPKFQRPHGKSGRRDPYARRPNFEIDTTILYGWHPVAEALRNGKRTIRRILATENSARRLSEELGTLPIEPEIVRPDEINRLLEPDAVHQGLYAEADPRPRPQSTP